MQIARVSALLVGSTLAFSGAAQASLIFDLGTSSTGGLGDEGVADANFGGFTFSYYGSSYSSAKVNANGGMTFPAGVATNWPYGNGNQTGTWWTLNAQPAIAALYDDLNNETVTHGTSKIGANTFANSYSLTWSGGQIYGGQAASFQVSLFNANQTVTLGNGDQFNFLAGDVAISYGSIPTVYDGGTAVAGVANGGGSDHDGAFGLTDGRVTNATSSLIPSGQSFFLFRWNSGESSFDTSIGTFAPVPEPGALALLGLAGLVARRRR